MFPLENGAFEMLVLGALALIIVGPKDLPMLMRKVGQFTAKMRGLAAEFRASFEEMARQSELDELRKEVEALRTGQYVPPVSGEIDKAFYDYDQTPAIHPELHEALPAPEAAAEPQILDPAPLSPPAPPAPPAPKKPRARKAAATEMAAAAAPKPRKPRAKVAPPAEPGA
jgi:sec-independent protein translocase protein TatB